MLFCAAKPFFIRSLISRNVFFVHLFAVLYSFERVGGDYPFYGVAVVFLRVGETLPVVVHFLDE